MTEKKTKGQSTKGKVRKFAIGDLAVYPAHGVGEITAIETRVVNGEEHDFYIMKVLENGMVIMIPTWNVESVGLRDIIDEKDIYTTIFFSKCLSCMSPDGMDQIICEFFRGNI